MISPRQLYLLTALMVAVGLAAMAGDVLSGNYALTAQFFGLPVVLFFLFTCVVQVRLSWKSWLAFREGEALELSWFLFLMAACCRLASIAIVHVIIPNLPKDVSLDAEIFRQMGYTLSGPIMTALLVGGFALVLKAYRRVGMIARLKPLDYVWIVLSAVFALHQVLMVITWFPKWTPLKAFFSAFNVTADPLLTILLAQSIILWRSSQKMAGGLIANCWGAAAMAGLLTTLGDVAYWLEAWVYIEWPLTFLGWLIWVPQSAAFAAVPAYQVEALSRAWEPEQATAETA